LCLVSHPGDPPCTRRLRLLFLGRFRPLSSSARVFDLLRLVEPALGAQLCLAAVGALSPEDEQALRAACPSVQYEELEPVPYEALATHLARADIALLSTSIGRHQIIPAKLWDYLPAGRPILSLCENPEIAQILSETGTGQQLRLPEAAHWLNTTLRNWQSGTPPTTHPVPSALERFSAPAQADDWASLFDALVGGAAA
jgi:hypothetical protein